MSHGAASGNAFARRSQNATSRSLSTGSMSHQLTSPVMNETLSVIEEHITDMHTPRQSFLEGAAFVTNNDGFRRHSPHRLSCINGNETDEEDDIRFTEAEVRAWSPSQVAEHLEQLGADRAHCSVFKEQEISGDVLLDMDRETMLLKEFELGTIGRRLQLFQKIQRFQTEVKGPARPSGTSGSQHSPPRSSPRTASMTSYSDNGRDRTMAMSGVTLASQAGGGTAPGAVLPKIPAFNESPTSYAVYGNNRQRSQSNARQELVTADATRHQGHATRPSTTSVRSVPHNRRHSSIDYTSAPTTPVQESMNIPPSPHHARQASFDANWQMITDGVPGSQPSTGSGQMISPSLDVSRGSPHASDFRDSPTDPIGLDRGYFSSNENEPRRLRSLLRKREVGGHTRAPSDGYSSLRLSEVFRHIRSGSTDSVPDATNNESSFLPLRSMSRAFNSSNKGSPSSAGRADSPSLEAFPYSLTTPGIGPTGEQNSPLVGTDGKPKPAKVRATGLRAISDAISGNEGVPGARASLATEAGRDPAVKSVFTESSSQSTASAGNSVLVDERKDGATSMVPTGKYVSFPANSTASRRKTKQETSAYTRGLEKKTPAEQIAGSDYSGWMKKKSKNLGKWHSRLFVLRGRRLSYYYSEDDTEEKGVIDISSHRVLPVGKDLLTNFHATLRGAGSGPVSPEGASLQTAAQIDATKSATGASDAATGPFIFKLVPPRPGVSKAVNFTQPKLHFLAVPSLQEGRYWMAALMKATIERDDIKPVSSTYKEKTISLNRARELRMRPNEFLGDSDGPEGGALQSAKDPAEVPDLITVAPTIQVAAVEEAEQDTTSDIRSAAGNTLSSDAAELVIL
jgi:hypothetical protein